MLQLSLNVDEIRADLERKTSDDLREVIVESVTGVASLVVRGAIAVTLLVQRGEELPDDFIPEKILRFLRMVGGGQLDPRLLLGWEGTPVFKYAKCLPLDQQAEIVDDKPIKVVEHKDGGFSNRNICPSHMTSQQAELVFAKDGIRTVPAQIAILTSEAHQPPVDVQQIAGRDSWKVTGSIVRLPDGMRDIPIGVFRSMARALGYQMKKVAAV
jgi:hypothetical protein